MKAAKLACGIGTVKNPTPVTEISLRKSFEKSWNAPSKTASFDRHPSHGSCDTAPVIRAVLQSRNAGYCTYPFRHVPRRVFLAAVPFPSHPTFVQKVSFSPVEPSKQGEHFLPLKDREGQHV